MYPWSLFLPGAMFILSGIIAFLLPDRLRLRLHGRVHKQLDGEVVEWPEADRFMGMGFVLTGVMSANAALSCLLFQLSIRNAWVTVMLVTTLFSLAAVVIIEHLFSGSLPRERKSDR